MVVHVPLSLEAQTEACLLIFSHMNLVSNYWGFYCLTNPKYAYWDLCIKYLKQISKERHAAEHMTHGPLGSLNSVE
jgi:hypothetical protein